MASRKICKLPVDQGIARNINTDNKISDMRRRKNFDIDAVAAAILNTILVSQRLIESAKMFKNM